MSNQQSAPSTLTRQQLYDKIRETSKEEYILSEMIRLGYWKENTEKPSLPAQLIQEEGQLQKRLNELVAKQRQIENPEEALKALHKERKKLALERRELTKKAKNQERYERAVAWFEAQQKDLCFLGQGTAIGLQNDEANKERLAQQGLPNFATGEELASAMGVSINELRFLSYDRKTTQTSHYQQFLIPKKTGGTRRISAPMPRLKRLQYWVLGNILGQLTLHDSAHGFVSGRSIVSNAQLHVGKSVVINMDLQDFFPTISYRRIKGLFQGFGYSEKIATVLALLCSEPERDEVELDGQNYFTATDERHLPQGAPTSPAISNLICRKMDKRIVGACEKLNFTYTRYADDLTFSYNGEDGKTAPVTELLWRVKKILIDEGFTVHPNKTRIMRRGARQEVTGIVVNDKLSINRATLKKFRALLFQIEKDGPDGKSWGQGELFYSITGYANYVAMVNPEKGRVFQEKVSALKVQYHHSNSYAPIAPMHAKTFAEKAIAGQTPTETWWQPSIPEKPVQEQTAQEIEETRKAEKQAKNAHEPASPNMPSQQRRHNNSSFNAEQEKLSPLDKLLKSVGKWLFAIAALLLWIAYKMMKH